MQDSVSARMVALRNVVLISDEQGMRAEVRRIRELEAVYKDTKAALHKTFETSYMTPQEKAMLARLEEQEHAAVPVMAEVEQLGLADKLEEATQLLMGKVAPLQSAWLDTMDALARFEDQLNAEAAADARAAYTAAVQLMLSL